VVVGSVVGGLAGVALLLVLALLILRWLKQKRRMGPQRLPENDTAEPPTFGRSLPPVAQRSSSLLPAAAAGFMSRFSAASKESSIGSPAQERGFQRIEGSGRKLPSEFSSGITADEAAALRAGTISETSFYRDSQGFYGGTGVDPSTEIGPATDPFADKETLMPSPARTPVVHQPYTFPSAGNDSTLASPPLSPMPATAAGPGTLGRSHPSHDGSRGSKFTEDV
jgi:hypothetical protein